MSKVAAPREIFTVAATKDTRIKELKAAIEKEKGYPAGEQKLIHPWLL